MLGQTTTFALNKDDRALMLEALIHASECDAIGADEDGDADALYSQLKKGKGATRLTVNCGRILVLRRSVKAASESESFSAYDITLGRLYRRLEHAGYRVLR